MVNKRLSALIGAVVLIMTVSFPLYAFVIKKEALPVVTGKEASLVITQREILPVVTRKDGQPAISEKINLKAEPVVVTLKETPREILSRERDTCSAVKRGLRAGMNAKDIVQTGIKLGHSACLVIKCAIEGGGDTKEIITGAVEAGATPDVVSRCAVDAGADPQEVAESIMFAAEAGLCYYDPEGLGYSAPGEAGLTPTEITFPGGDPEGGFISPYTF